MTGPQQPYGQPAYGQPYPPPRPKRGGLPTWAVVLLVLGGGFVALVLLATCAALVAGSDGETDAAATVVTSTTAPVPAGSAPVEAPAPPPPAEAPATGPSGPLQHPEDVTVVSCGQSSSLGWGEAQVTIVNNSSEASTYSVEVVFESPDGSQLYGEGFAYVSRLEPGQSATEEVSALDEVPADVVCRLTGAQRTAA